MSPEPLVSCAQAAPAKGHDGLWGREWVIYCQPRSQGLSSSPLSLTPGSGKKRDPGNEVDVLSV